MPPGLQAAGIHQQLVAGDHAQAHQLAHQGQEEQQQRQNVQCRPPADCERLHPLAVSHLIVGNDFVCLAPKMLEKRARIQAARQRPDAEILPLFGTPFQANYADANYERIQMKLARLFGIPGLFGQ